MDRFKLENELKKGHTTDTAMSSLVRSRLDETYASLSELSVPRTIRPKRSRLRRAASVIAAASIFGTVIFASGFVSPVMAVSLKNIPFIGSIFSSIEADIGLRNAGDIGLASTMNSNVSYKDVKLEVTETVFDGSRAAFLLNVTAPNLHNGEYNNGKKVVELSSAIQNIGFTIDGKRQDDSGIILKGLYYGSAGEAHPNLLIFEQVLDPFGTGSIPDSFNAEVSITLEGIDHEFKLDLPFHKHTDNIVSVHPNAVAANDELTFSVNDLQVTPVTTRFSTSMALNNVVALEPKDEIRLIRIGAAVFDDQGRQLPALNGEGVIEANRLKFDSLYGSTPGTTNYLIVKPFVIKDDFTENVQENQYIKGLEIKIELPASK